MLKNDATLSCWGHMERTYVFGAEAGGCKQAAYVLISRRFAHPPLTFPLTWLTSVAPSPRSHLSANFRRWDRHWILGDLAGRMPPPSFPWLSIFVLFRIGAVFGDFGETWRHKVFGLL